MKSIMQDKKECYITKRTTGLQEHHIFGRKNRRLSEKYGLKVWLVPELHNASDEGVHGKNGARLNLELKKEAQRAAMKHYGWSKQKFMEIFGKNYL